MPMVSRSASHRLRSSSPSPVPVRLHPLHNFYLPPDLKWCSKKRSRSGPSDTSGRDLPRRGPGSESGGLSSSSSLQPSADGGVEEIGRKIFMHLRAAAKNMKLPATGESGEEGDGGGESTAAARRPWNLRKRRAACVAPAEEIGEVPTAPAEGQLKSGRLRSNAAERNERRKFSAVLSWYEVEEDFFIITGSKPSRRPKKRDKIAQKHIEMVTPGTWLTEVTSDMY